MIEIPQIPKSHNQIAPPTPCSLKHAEQICTLPSATTPLQKIHDKIQYPNTPTAMSMAANFMTATLSPFPAMTPSLLAEPLREVPMVEMVSEVESRTCWSRALS